MRSTSILTCVMTMVSKLTIISIFLHIYLQTFSPNIADFFGFQTIPAVCLLTTSNCFFLK